MESIKAPLLKTNAPAGQERIGSLESNDSEKTEPYRVRSLRAIIHGANHAKAMQRSHEWRDAGSVMDASPDDTNEDAEDSYLSPPTTNRLHSNGHGTPDRCTSSELEIRTPQTKREKRGMESIETFSEFTAEACSEMIFRVPSDLSFGDRSPSLIHKTRSTPRKRSPVRVNEKVTEWEEFRKEMGRWVQDIEMTISKHSIGLHQNLWERARLGFLRKVMFKTLESLKEKSERKSEESGTLESYTSGVSFVKESESHQIDVSDEYDPLPPAVIQPPNLKRISSQNVESMIETIQRNDVLMVRMPDRDDVMIKKYLLNTFDRREFTKNTPTAMCHVIQGLQSICPWISDHVFLCCHYRLEEDGQFRACLDAKSENNGLNESNVQLVMIIRKGIGGTWALRNAARSLEAVQILPLIMGNQSLTEVDFDSDILRNLGNKTSRKLSPSRSLTSVSPKTPKPRSKFMRTVSVWNRHQPRERTETPPVCEGSVAEWFSSVRSTAQIVHVASQSLETPNDASTTPSSPARNAKGMSPKRDSSVGARSSKAKTAFMQKTLKRRLTACNSAPPANIKIHTLSCRLEMFVAEDLWTSLDRGQKNVLNSVVMGVEEWFQGKIQSWNQERMFQYCQELSTAVQMNFEHLENKGPKIRIQSEREPEKLVEDEAFQNLLDVVPEMPQDVECVSFSTVKATAIANSIHRPGQPDIPWPFYLINTRDCFKYDLIEVKKWLVMDNRSFVKTEFYFPIGQVPDDYGSLKNPCPGGGAIARLQYTEFLSQENEREEAEWKPVDGFPFEPPKGALPVGVTTYTQIFNHEELKRIESKADEVHENSKRGCYPPECFHPTIGKNGALKRTKYFFGARYLWTREQLADPDACVAKGVRVDVPPNPVWMKNLVEDPLVASKIVEPEFINSWALNMYHDGSEGIQSHFDDSQRFCQPIYSLRLFSDSRLSFGTQLYGFTNGAFYVPMPRGCITIMHDKSYAANAIKHCVRPCDMSGKSAGLIMRKINAGAWKEAVQYQFDETVSRIENFHIDDKTIPDKSTVSSLNDLDDWKRNDSTKAEEKNFKEGKSTVRKLRATESKVTKQIVEGLIKTVEGEEKRAQRELKQQEGEKGPSVKRRRKTGDSSSSSLKSISRETSNMRLTDQAVISAANQILEKAIGGKNRSLVQVVSSLLDKFGATWIQLLRNKKDIEPSIVSYESVQTKTKPILAFPEPSTTPFGSLPSTSEQELTHCDAKANLMVPVSEESSSLSIATSDLLLQAQAPLHEMNTRHKTRHLRNLLTNNTQNDDGEKEVSVVEDSKTERMESNEPKRLLNGLLEFVLKKAVSYIPEWKPEEIPQERKPFVLPDDIMKQVAQETEFMDFALLSDASLSPSKTIEISNRGSVKRTYKLVATDICFRCERSGFDPRYNRKGRMSPSSDELWLCSGSCRRCFHTACVNQIDGKCEECATGCHRCHQCGEGANHLGAVLKCSLGVCGRYYHIPCVMQIPETNVLQGNWIPVRSAHGDTSCLKFRCPLHYCKVCGVSGANILSVICIRCPTAYHARCRPDACSQLSKKLIICPRHNVTDLNSK